MATEIVCPSSMQQEEGGASVQLFVMVHHMFQLLVARTVILMVSVCQAIVNVTQDGRGRHVM